ncbi:MAG: IS1182 family transposase [Candidatus Methanoperedens sp.]|nr:IS1182 family transposase [Candidatus Methanoperedens sp.]
MSLNVRNYSNKDNLLFPASIGDYLSEGHLAWAIDDVVESLDLIFLYKKVSSVGNPSYHPKMMLKILFYGYATSNFSSRRIAKGTETDIAFIFLAGMQKPDFRTISDFRKNNAEELPKLFVQIVRLCKKLGLVGLSHIAIDSTVIKASADRDRTYDRERFILEEQVIQDKIKELLDVAQKVDDEEDRIFGPSLRGDELPESVRSRKKRLEKLQEAKKDLEQRSLKEINLTDSDATFQREKGKVFRPGYRAEVVVDGKEQIIVACDVVNKLNDRQELLPSIERAVDNLPEIATQDSSMVVTADSDYSAMESLKKLEEQKPYVDAYIPDSKYQSKQDGNITDEDSPFHKKCFSYNPDKNVYICPNQKELTFRYRRISRSKAYYSLYRCRYCQDCPYFGTCTKSPKGRAIWVYDNQEQIYKMRRKLDSAEGKRIYAKRKIIIEPVFGNIKHNLRFREFLLRGLRKVKSEFTLIAIVHNIRKIAKFLKKLLFSKLPRSELTPVLTT